jgi:hypothetical protein
VPVDGGKCPVFPEARGEGGRFCESIIPLKTAPPNASYQIYYTVCICNNVKDGHLPVRRDDVLVSG